MNLFLTMDHVYMFLSMLNRCDCYILKDILQNWSDEDSSLILKNLRSVVKKNDRVLIIENIMHTGRHSEERVRKWREKERKSLPFLILLL